MHSIPSSPLLWPTTRSIRLSLRKSPTLWSFLLGHGGIMTLSFFFVFVFVLGVSGFGISGWEFVGSGSSVIIKFFGV